MKKIYKKITIIILTICIALTMSFNNKKSDINAIVLVDDVTIATVIIVAMAFAGFSVANKDNRLIKNIEKSLSNASQNAIRNIAYTNRIIDGVIAFTYQEITTLVNDVINVFKPKLSNVNDTVYLDESGQFIADVGFIGLPTMSIIASGNYSSPTGTTFKRKQFDGMTTWYEENTWTFSSMSVLWESQLSHLNIRKSTLPNSTRTISTTVKVIPYSQAYNTYITGIPLDSEIPIIVTQVSCTGSCVMEIQQRSQDRLSTSYVERNINGALVGLRGSFGSTALDLKNYYDQLGYYPELALFPSVMLMDGTLSLDPPIKTNEPTSGDIDVYDNRTKVLSRATLPLILLGYPIDGDLNGLGPDNVVLPDDRATAFDRVTDIDVGETDLVGDIDVGDTTTVTDTGTFADWLSGVLSGIGSLLTNLINAILNWLNSIWQLLRDILSFLSTILSGILSAIAGAVTALLDGIYSIFGNFIDLVSSILSAIWKILEFLMRLLIFIIEKFYQLIMLLIDGLILQLPTKIMALVGISSIFAVLPTPLDSLATIVCTIAIYMLFINIAYKLKQKGKPI